MAADGTRIGSIVRVGSRGTVRIGYPLTEDGIVVSPARTRGVLAPVVTPFTADLRPDPARLVRHCRWLLDQDVGLGGCGTDSDANSLSVRESRDLLDANDGAGI